MKANPMLFEDGCLKTYKSLEYSDMGSLFSASVEHAEGAELGKGKNSDRQTV